MQRKLFAAVAAGRSAVLLKSEYIKEHGLPARLFNAVRVSLDGKMSAVRAAQKLRVDGLERRIAQAERQVAKAEEQGRWQQVHQKRRRLANLKSRLAGLEADIAAGRVRLCFGSKRLWRKQHHLEQNGYASHEEWLQDWQDARSDEFLVLGSRDETAGCQLCVATVADDGTLILRLRLRLPDCLANQHGKYLVIQGVRFAYGTSRCWRDCRATPSTPRTGASMVRRRPGPPHWDRPSATGSSGTARAGGCSPLLSCRSGDNHRPVSWAIGVDLNADHLAVVETDASGQLHQRRRVPLVTYGKNTRQSEALIGDAVASVVEYAEKSASPSSSSGWTPPEEGCPGGRVPPGTPGCCPVSTTARSRRTSFPRLP